EVNGPLIDDNTLFGLASVSKAITATALAALAEKDIVSFEDRISINGVNLSLKNILSHTTGYKIRGDSEIEKGDYAQSKDYKIEELIKVLNISSYALPVNSRNLAYPHSKEKDKIAFPSNYQKIVPTSAGNRPHIISKKSLNLLFTPLARADDVFNWNILPFKNGEVTSSYCLGWRKLTLKSRGKLTLVFHSGYINGATAFVGIIP
ncbi:unnamed protein product, partial [Rotaria magnacalcarata]